jgi:outer membrane protein
MKNSTIVNIILGLSILALYIIHFTSGKKGSEGRTGDADGTAKSVTVAYVKMDSVLFTYALAKSLNADFLQKQEAYKKEYSNKRIKFERDAQAFQDKVQRGGFLTEATARQEQERLIGLQQEIEKLDYELTQQLNEMQGRINQQVVDSISSFLKSFNADKKYDIILNSSSMLEGSPDINITKEVAAGLNLRYKP